MINFTKEELELMGRLKDNTEQEVAFISGVMPLVFQGLQYAFTDEEWKTFNSVVDKMHNISKNTK